MSHLDPTSGEHPRDVLAAYALDAVEGGERDAIESHLAVCSACRRELAMHEEVLAQIIVDEAPPAAVWDRIAQETAPQAPRRVEPPRMEAPREAPAPGLRPPSPSVPPAPPGQERRAHDDVVPLTDLDAARHRRQGRAPSRWTRVLAAAAAVAVVAGIGAVGVSQMGGDEPAPAVAIGAIESPDGTELAVVTRDDDGTTQVEFTDADELPEDRTYQLWSTASSEPVSLGVLGSGGDREVDVTLPEGTTPVAISNEPAGGSPAPTLVVGQGEVSVPA
jgi:anti-sigma-K factor RskA